MRLEGGPGPPIPFLVFLSFSALAFTLGGWMGDWLRAGRISGHMTAITAAESSEAAVEDFKFPPVKGLGSILEGWTFTNNWSVDDWRIDTILQAHGAKEAESRKMPDIFLAQSFKDGELVLWVQYRGRDRFVRKMDDPEWGSQITKILIDMARLRLAELREEISRKEGEGVKQ